MQIQATAFGTFAAILEDGSVITWGRADSGGDTSAVQDQLKGVEQIKATEKAFAAILEDGSVVTWGYADFGGDSLAVQDQLNCVQQIQASAFAFAAILKDGSVITWGSVVAGGDSSAVRDQLKGVQQIKATEKAFAAILEDKGKSRGLNLLHTIELILNSQTVTTKVCITPGHDGFVHALVVTVRQFEISSRVCGRFKPLTGPLLRFWKMDPSSPGVIQSMAVTVRQFEIS